MHLLRILPVILALAPAVLPGAPSSQPLAASASGAGAPDAAPPPPRDDLPLIVARGWSNDVVRGDGLDPAATENLFSGGDFASRPNDWRTEFVDGATGRVEWDDGCGRSGAGSLKIVKTNGKGYIRISAASPVKAKRGQALAFRGYYHTHDATRPTTLAMVRLAAASDNLTYDKSGGTKGLRSEQEAINAPPGMWMRRLVNIKLEASETATLTLIAYGNPHTIWWDDLSVEDAGEADRRWATIHPFSAAGYLRPELMPEAAFQERLRREPEHTASMTTLHGKSVLLVDGKPTPMVMFKEPTLSFMNHSGWALEREGIRLQSQIATFGPAALEDNPEAGQTRNRIVVEGMWQGSNRFDFSSGVRALDLAMRASSNSLFIVSLAMQPYAAFVDDYPAEAWLDAEGRKAYGTRIHVKGFADSLPAGDQWWPSYYSLVWREQIQAAIAQFIAELKQSGHAKRVVGFHFDVGHDRQFASRGLDFSPSALRGFRAWLRAAYVTDAALQHAWKNDRVTLENAAIPAAMPAGIFLDPASQQNYVDYYQFYKTGTLHILEELAATCRQAIGKEVIMVKWCMGLYAGAYNAEQDLNAFVDSKQFDFIVPQPTYHQRSPGWSVTDNQPFSTFHLRGKGLMLELDLRTYARTRYDEIGSVKLGRAESFAMWQSIQRRLVGQQMARDMGYWYFDLDYGWFLEPAIAGDIGRTVDFHRRHFERGLSETTPWHPDVAVVLDEESQFWMSIGWSRYNFPLYTSTSRQFDVLGNSGVPYAIHLAKDFLERPALLEQYKMLVFLDAYRTDARKQAFYTAAKGKGRHLVWLYAPGYVADVGLSLDAMRATTGIRIGLASNRVSHAVLLSDPAHPLARGLAPRQDWAGALYDAEYLGVISQHEGGYYWPPRFYADDPAAATLATFEDGKSALAVRVFPEWTSVYVASPGGISAELFNAIARRAGAYVCSEAGNDVAVNERLLSIHGTTRGRRTFRLPRRATVVNLADGRVLARDVIAFQADIEAQSSYWFSLE